MSWPTINTPTIINDTTTLNAQGLGTITDALVDRTNELHNVLGNRYENAIVISDSGMGGLPTNQSEQSAIGLVVYFDTDQEKYLEAQPVSTTEDGMIVPAKSAYIAGLICGTPTSDGVGKLLVAGVISATSAGFSSGATPGPYYLGENGTLVPTPPEGRLVVYCGYLTTTGWFIFNPSSPSPKITAQTIAAPIAGIIPGPGILMANEGDRTVSISAGFVSGGLVTSGGRAVSTITSGGLIETNVVNQLNDGLGVDITQTAPGVFSIAANGLSRYLDMQTINANNVLIGGGINDSLVTFPAGIVSSIVGLVRLPHAVPAEGIKLFVWLKSSSTNIGNLSAAVTPIRQGAAQETINSISFEQATGAEFTSDNIITTGDDLLRIVFTANSPASAISLQALGVLV